MAVGHMRAGSISMVVGGGACGRSAHWPERWTWTGLSERGKGASTGAERVETTVADWEARPAAKLARSAQRAGRESSYMRGASERGPAEELGRCRRLMRGPADGRRSGGIVCAVGGGAGKSPAELQRGPGVCEGERASRAESGTRVGRRAELGRADGADWREIATGQRAWPWQRVFRTPAVLWARVRGSGGRIG